MSNDERNEDIKNVSSVPAQQDDTQKDTASQGESSTVSQKKVKKGAKGGGIWQKKAKEQFVSIVFFAVIVLVLINSLVFPFRIDTTENKVYSISQVTIDILRDLEDIVYIDYYISPKLKLQAQGTQQILDTLQEIAARSSGSIIVEEIDPETLSEEELRGKGLEPRQIQFVEKNEASFAVVYSGIVISYQERNSVIPFTLEPSIIEYQVVSKIVETYNDDARVVGVLFLDTYYDDQQNRQVIQQILEQDFEVKIIEKDDAPFPDDVDVLYILGNQDVSNELAYRIDQFVMQGKGVFFAVDRANVDLQRGLFATANDTVLNKMIESYGLTIKDEIALDSLNKQIPLSGGAGVSIFQSYPMWPTIAQQNVALDHPITNRFAGLDMYWTSPIVVRDDVADYVTNIVKTTEDGWTVGPNAQGNGFNVVPDNTGFFTSKNEENTKQYNLISVFNGPLSSAVEAGIISTPEESIEEYISSTEQARFLAAGSHYFISPLYQFSNAQYNISFVSNSTEWLSADVELLQIKSKNVRNLQLNKIQDEAKKEGYMFVVQLINNFFVPLLIVIVGAVVLFMRRNLSRRRY